MKNRELLILAVCDGGVMISSMVANKIETLFSATEVDVLVVSLLPMSVASFLKDNPVDFIVSTSPLLGEISVPILNGLPMLTGYHEEKFNHEIVALGQSRWAEKLL